MGLLDVFQGNGTGGADELSNGAGNFLGALGAGLLTGNRYQPIGPGFGQRMDQLTKLAAAQGDKASIAALLKLYGFTDQEALSLASNPKAAELAIAKKQLDTNNAQTADALANAPGLSGLFGGDAGGAPRVSPPAPGGPAAGASLNGGGVGSFVNAVVSQESDGNPSARNPNSSATGLGQFTDRTWAGLMRSRPDLGLTSNGRTDPEQSKKAIQALAEENAPQLAGSGHEVNPANLYMGHFLGGAGGVRFLNGLRQNPNALASSYAASDAVEANRAVFFNRDGTPRTAQQVYDLQTRKFQGLGATQTADTSGRVGAPAAAGDGTAIQTEAGPVAFTPSLVPGADGRQDGSNTRPADAAGIEAARREALGRGVPPVGSGQVAPPPPAPRPNRGAVQVAETEDDVRRLEGSVTGPADMPAPSAQPAGFYVPGANGRPGVTYNGTSANALAGREAQATGAADGPPPAPLEKATSLSDRRKKAAETYDYWSVVLAKSANNKPLAEFAKSRLDVAKEFLKPSEIEAKLDAAGLTGADRQQAARNMLSDNRPANVQEYEYSRTNPGYEDFRERQRAKAEPNINAQAEQRRAVAASLGMDPNSPGYKSYVATGRMPNEDKPGPSAGDKKVIQQAEDEIINLDNTLATLKRAKELNPQTYQGVTAKAFAQVPSVGQAVSSVSTSTQKKAEATREFGQIMSMEAIKSMSQTLKGATTDAEMARFMEILGDPSTPIEIRGRTIDRMMTLAQRQRELSQDRARDLRGGTYYNPDYGRAPGQPSGQGRQSAPASARSPAPLSDLEVEARRRGLIQ